jgi:BirA family biotin operon repressor/biotin-[acetyl-CoA-carboxylase] ligase
VERSGIEWHEALPSTMERAHERAEQGAPAGTTIAARRQTAGRGRHGRSWHAEAGGLWLSVIGRPGSGAILDPLAIRIGLALAELLEGAVRGLPTVMLKWPNDLLLDGRKLGGILVETRWQGEQCLWVVVGVGLNLQNPIPEPLAVRAVAMAELLPAPTPEAIAGEVAAAVVGACRGGALRAAELDAWRRRDALFGRRIEGPVGGMADGITPTGALRVVRDDGIIVEVPSGVVSVAS